MSFHMQGDVIYHEICRYIAVSIVNLPSIFPTTLEMQNFFFLIRKQNRCKLQIAILVSCKIVNTLLNTLDLVKYRK
jgi:hypothetical protein